MDKKSWQKKMNPSVAVIGAGYWGINHVRNFSEIGALNLVCDTSHASLAKIGEKFPSIRLEASYSAALSDPGIQGVVIATPAETHFDLAAAAIEAGKDVLVEKPLTLDVSEGERLVKLAEQRRSILMVGHLLEYHPAVLRLREL